jgi:hypothetical protein
MPVVAASPRAPVALPHDLQSIATARPQALVVLHHNLQ